MSKAINIPKRKQESWARYQTGPGVALTDEVDWTSQIIREGEKAGQKIEPDDGWVRAARQEEKDAIGKEDVVLVKNYYTSLDGRKKYYITLEAFPVQKKE